MTATTNTPPLSLAALFGRPKPAAEFAPLPCRACGLIVKYPDPSRAEVLRVFTKGGYARADFPMTLTEVPVTRCDACTDRRELAAEMLREHPQVGRELGDVALDQLDAALGALDLRGFGGRRAFHTLAATDQDLRELLAALLPTGVAAVWSEGYALSSAGQSKRWAHVTAEIARSASQAYRQLVHYRMEPPKPYVPPEHPGALRGCLICGIRALDMRQRDALAAWGDLQLVYPGELGGQAAPEPLSGYFCPECRISVQNAGAPGVPAAERALIWYASGLKRVTGFRLNFPSSARAWAAMPPGTPANSTPWAHVGLDKLRADLAHLEQRGAVRRPLPGEPR